MWIDPELPRARLVGNDGGLDMSYDGGKTWIKLDAQPVGSSTPSPSTWPSPTTSTAACRTTASLKGSSRARPASTSWRSIGGGDGMYVQVDPRDDSTTYWGFQFGFYFRNGQGGRSQVRPRDKLKEPALRYNWQTPILLSSTTRHPLLRRQQALPLARPGRDLDGRSRDDLTAPKPRRRALRHAGHDRRVAERFGLLWAGTDDGYVWVTTTAASTGATSPTACRATAG